MMELYLANVSFVCGLVFLLAGFIMHKWPPKKINGLYGYRTGSSMRSQERWDFAQAYAAGQMIRCGVAMTVTGVLMALFSIKEGVIMAVGMALLIMLTLYLIYSTEAAIKKKFKN